MKRSELVSYAPPEQTPNCRCRGNPMAAMFCMQGHMLECHVGMDCATAKCSHLAKYGQDFDPEDGGVQP